MIYKGRLFKELNVEFQGEDGIDCGALHFDFLKSLHMSNKSSLGGRY